jgi:hypothetical protein
MPESAQLSHTMPIPFNRQSHARPERHTCKQYRSLKRGRKEHTFRRTTWFESSQMRRPQQPSSTLRMAAPLVPLHVTPHTERLPATRVRTLVRLLTRMGVGVDLQTTRSTEGLIAGRADISVLGLREDGLRVLIDVVVVLPDVAVGLARHALHSVHGHCGGLGWEVGRERALVVEAWSACWVGWLRGRVVGAAGHCAGRVSVW